MAFWHARLVASNVIILYVVAKNGECWRKESMDHWIHFTETITFFCVCEGKLDYFRILCLMKNNRHIKTVIFVQKIFEGNIVDTINWQSYF